MIRNVDLFTVATGGINASSKLLQTTGSNIANVNTEGYVREQTVFHNSNTNGVGVGTTERVISVFAQNQMRRDITSVGELTAFQEKTSALDNMLANEANSLSSGLSEFFASLQTAANDPTNLASRDLVLGQGRAMLRRMDTLTDFMQTKEKELNLEFESQVNHANALIKNIGDLNKAILVANGGNQQDQPTALLNERDRAIDELAELMSIEVREGSSQNGSLVVNLTSGESLVLDDGSFNLFSLSSDADLSSKELKLQTTYTGAKTNTTINVTEDDLGGSLGGLFRYRNDILDPAMRDVGQMAVAFADAVNEQNHLGMDMDMQLGGDIFTLPTFKGMTYEGTTNTLGLDAQFTAGKGAEVTDADYKITVSAVSGGVPSQVDIEMINGDGSPKLDASGNPVVYTGVTIGAGFTELPGGVEIQFSSATGYAVGNEFLLQPTKTAALNIGMATSRPEDLAFASPIRIEPDSANLGDAALLSKVVTDTSGSAFPGNGTLDITAPQRIVFNSATDIEIFDGDTPPNSLGTITGATNFADILAQAGLTPGYDVSFEGIPVAGDAFTIEYNTDGVNDNANALDMAKLQQSDLVQLSSDSANQPRTLHEAYSSLVGRVGEEAASADISLKAAEAMKTQSGNWFDSVSGVSLDEEAANLVRYQQSYAAAARILSTAQELFNTILQAAR